MVLRYTFEMALDNWNMLRLLGFQHQRAADIAGYMRDPESRQGL